MSWSPYKYGYHQPAHFIGTLPQAYHQPVGAIPPGYHRAAQEVQQGARMQNRYTPAPYLGNCAPCQAAQLRGLGQARFDIGRDVTAGLVAFGVPTLYHYYAPKKWKRYGPIGNVAAVIALYFATAWAYRKVQEQQAAASNGTPTWV